MASLRMKLPKKLMVILTCITLMLPAYSFAQNKTDRPEAYEMGLDLFVARPIGLVATVLGTALFIVSLPLSALGGNMGDAADVLVVGPAKATFVRCLGCVSNLQRE